MTRTPTNPLRGILRSKKALVALVGAALFIATGHPDHAAGLLVAYVVGQGIADHGKGRE